MAQVAQSLDRSNIRMTLFSRVHLKTSHDCHAGIPDGMQIQNCSGHQWHNVHTSFHEIHLLVQARAHIHKHTNTHIHTQTWT
jgi:hypothetical protein